MTILNYIKDVGYLIVFLLFIFLLNPYALAIPAGYLLIITLVIFMGRELISNGIDKDFFLLLAFGMTYAMFDFFRENRGVQYLIIEATFPCFFYALGKILIIPRLSNKNVFYIIVTIGFIFSLSALLSILLNLLKGGFAQTNRLIPSIWSGKEILATGMASLLIYNTLLPAILLIYKKQLPLFIKLLFATLYGLTLVAGFRLGSRTLLAVAGLAIIITLIIALLKQNPLENLKLITTVALASTIFFIFFPINFDSPVFSTLAYRLQSTGAAESTLTAGGRTGLWADGFDKLLTHPLGWTSKRFHHNVWLDTAKVAGIIPLLFLIINNISCYIGIRKLFSFSSTQIDLGLKITFLLYFLATYLLFFTEPVIEGNFFSFVLYCLLFGILKRFLEVQKIICK